MNRIVMITERSHGPEEQGPELKPTATRAECHKSGVALSRPLPRILGVAILFFLGYSAANIESIVKPGLETSDYAVYALQVMRAKSFQEYLGPYSRFGFNHPGPISWYYLAFLEPPLFFVESDYGKHQLAQLLLNVLFVIVSLHLLALLLEKKNMTLAFLGALLFCLMPCGGRVFFDLWPPTFLIFPVLCFTLCSIHLALGRLEMLWVWLIASTFMIENNISTATVFLPLGTMSLALYLVNSRGTTASPVSATGGISRKQKAIMLFTALFLIAAAAPPVYEQLMADEGNLTKLLKFLWQNRERQHSIAEAVGYVSDYVRAPLRNLPFFDRPASVIAVVAGSIWSFFSGSRPWKYLVLYVWAALALSVFGATRVTGPLLVYILRYDFAIVSLLYFIAAVPILSMIPVPVLTLKANRIASILLVTIGLCTVVLLYRIPYEIPDSEIQDITHAINPKPGKQYEIMLAAGHHDRWEVATGLVLEFYRSGANVCAPETLRLFGKQLFCDSEAPRERVVLYKSKFHGDPVREQSVSVGKTVVEFGDLKPLEIPAVIWFDAPDDYFYGWRPAAKKVRTPAALSGTIALALHGVDLKCQYVLRIEGIATKSSQLRVTVNGVGIQPAGDLATSKEHRFQCPALLLVNRPTLVSIEGLASFKCLSIYPQ